MRREDLLDFNEAVQNPGKKLSYSVETELGNEADLDMIQPLTGQLDGVSTGNLLLVTGEFKTRCVLECARCGSPLEFDITFQMDDQFPVEGIPSCYASDGYAEVVADEPEPLFKHNALIRDHYIRQGLLVSIPVQPLCKHGWDEPCPNDAAPHGSAGAGAVHPALQRLQALVPEEGDTPE